MKILINGKTEELNNDATIMDVLSSSGLEPDSVVIELNEVIIETEDYAKRVLCSGDRLEILSFVGGG